MKKHITTMAETVLAARGPFLTEVLINNILIAIAVAPETSKQLENVENLLSNPGEYDLDALDSPEEMFEAFARVIAEHWESELSETDMTSIDLSTTATNKRIAAYFKQFPQEQE